MLDMMLTYEQNDPNDYKLRLLLLTTLHLNARPHSGYGITDPDIFPQSQPCLIQDEQTEFLTGLRTRVNFAGSNT